MSDKEKSKQEIKILVEKYKSIKESGKIKDYNEERTKKEFIEPLFESLGWDIRNKFNDDEVLVEHKVSKGRVDYAFRLNSIPKFFVEAKALKIDLDNIKYVQQAIDYAWHKSCTWAILTDFEGLKVYNAEWKNLNPLQSIFLSFRWDNYLERFDKLWWLSKESFEEGILDKEAEDLGKKIKKISVDEQLLQDLTKFRELLTKNILKNNASKNLSESDLDESVQRIIDRLIFIRVCEDKQLEEPILQPLIREEQNKKIYKKINEIFVNFDNIYNSKLFSYHLCQELAIDNYVLEKIIKGLFKTQDESIRYDFSAIDADVLGNIYEQYLGHILKKTAKRAKLKKGQAHRKEQGIYYTPTYVVDYIVKNTIGELAKDKKFNLKNIRVLDPACGSGSFLIKAFDQLVVLDKKKNGETNQTKLDATGESATYGRKVEILKNNIFGVDLDPKAVEIAQLNLLLKATEKKHRLPLLQENIKVGNSLIDDKMYSKKAFKWEEEFKDIINKGGFDVVIGNPPYVRIQTLNRKEVSYFNEKYESPIKNYDIYILFIERGFSLLKKGGMLGLILPHKFFQGEMGKNIRKFIYDNKCLYKIIDFGSNQVFGGATTYTCLLFLYKRINKTFHYHKFQLGDNYKHLQKLKFEKKDEEILKENIWNFSSGEIQKILNIISKQKDQFSKITKKIYKGSSTGNDKIFLLDVIEEKKGTFIVHSKQLDKNIELEKDILHPFLHGEDIKRYQEPEHKKLLLFPYEKSENGTQLIPKDRLKKIFPKTFEYLGKVKNELKKRKIDVTENNYYKYSASRSLDEYKQPKIMIPDMLVSNRITFDHKGIFYHGPAIHGVVFKEGVLDKSPLFYLGILNSKLFWFFIKNTSTALRGDTFRLTPEFLNPFCFPSINLKNKSERKDHDSLVNLVNKMLELNKGLASLQNKQTDEKTHLEKQIKKMDDEIDQEVYRLYELTKDEIKIIEKLDCQSKEG